MKNSIWNRGDLFIWVVGAGLAVSLIMVSGLLTIIVLNGLSGFWPKDMNQFVLKDGFSFFGQEIEREIDKDTKTKRVKIKRGNRDIYGIDFVWIDVADLAAIRKPSDVAVFERLEWGDFFGLIREVKKKR